MLLLTLITLSLNIQSIIAETPDANGLLLAQKVLAIERLLYIPGTIAFPVTPCNLTLNGHGNDVALGAQTAAQWVRAAFHDFITYDATTQTGGLDASITFETDREENRGLVYSAIPDMTHASFINETLFGFNLFTTMYVSSADFLALGVAVSLYSCDPSIPLLPLRAGRKDATGPGPFGVPQPQDAYNTSLANFARAGFSQSEMIQAIACGHSIGGVHARNHPEIVLDDPVVGPLSEGGDGADEFDSTPFNYDSKGVQEYLSGKGKAGGPLVTCKDPVFQSDLRIFRSDSNKTISAMATQAAFENTCLTIFTKMINSVPKGTQLSNPIVPRQWITIESHLDLSPAGVVQYSGQIGAYNRANGQLPATANYYYGTQGSGNTGYLKAQLGDPIDFNDNGVDVVTFGNVKFYKFNDTITTPTVNSFHTQDANHVEAYSEPINLNLFVVPSISFRNTIIFMNPPQSPTWVVRAAILTTLNPNKAPLSGIYYYPAQQPNSMAPKYTQVPFQLKFLRKMGLYSIFQGVVAQPGPSAGNAGGGKHVDVSFGAQKSSKFDLATFNSEFVGQCGNADLTTC